LDKDSIGQLLRSPALRGDGSEPELRETHISWVILAGEYAYKIKKPVNFGFLDFSTLEQRCFFCAQELALNKRFAPELYLAVVPITASANGPVLASSGQGVADGELLDYAVQMRRFDEAQLLSNIAARGELDRPLVRALGRELARQQATAPACYPVPGSDEPGSPAALRAAMVQNFAQARAYPLQAARQQLLEAVERWSLQRHDQLLALLAQRAATGRVLDGHGDAHLGNITLVDGRVRLFDCIEFNPAMRIMDSIAEIAFLCMDLQARGHEPESHCLLGDYLEYRGDYEGLPLLDLYRSYFAMVRAKVALLREPASSADITATEAYRDFCRYLQLAHSCCQRPAPFLAITHGVSGTGKSTIADKLVGASGALRLRSDVERKRLFGLAPEQRSAPADEAELYSSAMSRRTFDRLASLAAQSVAAGYAVIVDATFLHRDSRQRFFQLAQERQLPFAILDCVAPSGEVQRRLQEREQRGNDASEAGVRVMLSQQANAQPLTAREQRYQVQASSTASAGELWRRLQAGLRRPD
jgi:aminoglycoside phosphotransferase family enzyme/predicted kinase